MEEVTVGQGQAGVSHFHHFVLYDVLGVPPSVAADSPAWARELASQDLLAVPILSHAQLCSFRMGAARDAGGEWVKGSG